MVTGEHRIMFCDCSENEESIRYAKKTYKGTPSRKELQKKLDGGGGLWDDQKKWKMPQLR